jgi:hypothetical protein
MAWDTQLRRERQLSNESGNSRKLCEKCNTEVNVQNWSLHLRTKNHLKNDNFHFKKCI